MNYRDIETTNAFILLLSFDAEKVERKLPIKFKNKLLKLTNAIQPEIDIISKLKADLFQKYGKHLTIKYGKDKQISLAIPNTLARQRMLIQQTRRKDFDPFKVKYYQVRSHFVMDSPC